MPAAAKTITKFFTPKRSTNARKTGSADKKKIAKKKELLDEKKELVTSPVKDEPVEIVTAEAEVVKKLDSLSSAIEKQESVVPAVQPEVSEDKENVAPKAEQTVELVTPTAAPEPQLKKSLKKSKKPIKKDTDDDYKPEKTNKKSSKRRPKKEEKPDPKQPLITQFIRRSRRVPADMKRKQDQEQLKHYLSISNDEKLEHLVMKQTEHKGRGIFSARKLAKGEFVVEYVGDLLTMEEGREREDEYFKDPSIGSYIYFFAFKGKRYCIDATAESGRYGRLLNHSKTKPNCKTRLVEEPEGIPRLIIEAKINIPENTELLYDYGDRSQKALKAHPWLKD